MSKKKQNISVALEESKDGLNVIINKNVVGMVIKEDDAYVPYINNAPISSQVKTEDEAIGLIIASYNLTN